VTKSNGAGGPPPPPPPPPPGLFDDIGLETIPQKAGANALFADINKGDDVTKGKKKFSFKKCFRLFLIHQQIVLTILIKIIFFQGLKKVTADMQTHKNPSLRAQGAPPPIGPKPKAG